MSVALSPETRPAPAEGRSVHVYDLGTTNYADVHRLQQRLQAQRREGGGVDSLLLTEHRPVITLGRGHPVPDLRVPEDTVHNYGISIVQTERGGDITYHGPGQLVAYGIIDLKGWDCSVLDYVSGLETTVIGVLADWGIRGEQQPGARGVWVEGRKIASLGINVRRWVTMHGIALNIDPDMSHFDLINPCGLAETEMTSMATEVGKAVPFTEVLDAFVYHFGRTFESTSHKVDLETELAHRRKG
ncbi:MAG: lipoyl(octanoyl) transferase LipB [Chloroflexi bacterium]|nr:lipoyl(octanoyl) transferase LipB [Chloroflexota bacterium]